MVVYNFQNMYNMDLKYELTAPALIQFSYCFYLDNWVMFLTMHCVKQFSCINLYKKNIYAGKPFITIYYYESKQCLYRTLQSD